MRSKISLAYLFALTAYATAQSLPPLPTGWTSQGIDTAIVLKSPANAPGSQIVVMLLPPFHAQGEIKSWFGNQALAIARLGGNTMGATQVMQQEGIFVRVVQIENRNHVTIREVFYGYATQHGFTITVLTIPPAVGDQDPRVETANQYVQQLAAQKFELTTAVTQAPRQGATGAPVRNAQGQYVGAFGRSDIDLTYHAKSIIPKERDVPLKGVYVFVGFAYGASYGGVGTTMTWGQKATQQLLLLFANGVVAKTDLRGGNLAGKYQAEGFATMDVSNPAAVSGAPFGRWTDDGNTVHIQWNNGSPTDLTKNGQSLEGKGERWTPFHLADGERLEGTFVRQMEAGLRSQSIVLHKDGSFIGDGVNVTMGGNMVSPAFPERGAGTYEVRKGSMILYFANGFTQAIACVVDTTNTGEARTVLLNGFPFQRVR